MPTTEVSQQPQAQERKKRYTPPEGLLQRFIWRVWIWVKTTFAFSMMEPWEIVLVFCIVGIMAALLGVALVRYFPKKVIDASRRVLYYISGSDSLDDIWVNGRGEL